MPIVVPVRFRYATIDLWFDPAGIAVHRGDHVIVTTERGIEIGLAVDEAFNVNEETLRAPLKEVIRVATEEDLEYAHELSVKAQEAFVVFKQTAEAHELEMKPVACEYLFGGEKIVCYFAADDRVDFRELVKDLSSLYKMRVDMRQIGVRDQARLVGGFGHCGQELCCKRFGREFDPVSIRMAKAQDLALNPSKISGACGRLMCCLRYEFEAYKDFKSRAPKDGGLIDTPLGTAKVVGFDTPRENVLLRLEDGKSFTVPLKKMCCKSSNEQGSCCSRCKGGAGAEQEAVVLRPDAVRLEELATIDDQGLQLLLSQLETQKAMEALDAESQATDRDSERRMGRRTRSDYRERSQSSSAQSHAARQSNGKPLDEHSSPKQGRIRRRVRGTQADKSGQADKTVPTSEGISELHRSQDAHESPVRTPRLRVRNQGVVQHADRSAESIRTIDQGQQPARRVRRRSNRAQADSAAQQTDQAKKITQGKDSNRSQNNSLKVNRARRGLKHQEGGQPVSTEQRAPRKASQTGDIQSGAAGSVRKVRRRRPGDQGGAN